MALLCITGMISARTDAAGRSSSPWGRRAIVLLAGQKRYMVVPCIVRCAGKNTDGNVTAALC